MKGNCRCSVRANRWISTRADSTAGLVRRYLAAPSVAKMSVTEVWSNSLPGDKRIVVVLIRECGSVATSQTSRRLMPAGRLRVKTRGWNGGTLVMPVELPDPCANTGYQWRIRQVHYISFKINLLCSLLLSTTNVLPFSPRERGWARAERLLCLIKTVKLCSGREA